MITFTAGGVVDSGGIKRVFCSAKQAIEPGAIQYSWTLSIPPNYPPAIPFLGGTGPMVSVIAKVPGTYSATFTASSDRECPPLPITIGPEVVTVTPTAVLVFTTSTIAATTDYSAMPTYTHESDVMVTWDPPECAGQLEVVLVDPIEDYTPPDEGSLASVDATHWKYTAFNEPQSQLCPKNVKVWIAAMRGDKELTRKSMLVLPVHTFLTTGANANFGKDYVYLSLKYGNVLATTGGVFSSVEISADPCIRCPPIVGPCVAAWTSPLGGVTFGTDTFQGTENQAASIIGHELVHTTGVGECEAYTWEIDHQNGTGIPCDGTYLQDVLLKKIAACGE